MGIDKRLSILIIDISKTLGISYRENGASNTQTLDNMWFTSISSRHRMNMTEMKSNDLHDTRNLHSQIDCNFGYLANIINLMTSTKSTNEILSRKEIDRRRCRTSIWHSKGYTFMILGTQNVYTWMSNFPLIPSLSDENTRLPNPSQLRSVCVCVWP